MSETNRNGSAESTADIRIVGLNRDKTRKTEGSGTKYGVYFELSGTPPQGWGNIFVEEWKRLNPGDPGLGEQATIDRSFLVLHCALNDIGTKHLPVLHKAVAATNEAYGKYVREQAAKQQLREDVWRNERKDVDDMADSLHFKEPTK